MSLAALSVRIIIGLMRLGSVLLVPMAVLSVNSMGVCFVTLSTTWRMVHVWSVLTPARCANRQISASPAQHPTTCTNSNVSSAWRIVSSVMTRRVVSFVRMVFTSPMVSVFCAERPAHSVRARVNVKHAMGHSMSMRAPVRSVRVIVHTVWVHLSARNVFLLVSFCLMVFVCNVRLLRRGVWLVVTRRGVCLVMKGTIYCQESAILNRREVWTLFILC